MKGLTVLILNLIQDSDIEKKLDEAPDNAYSIGVLIGSLLPFILLVVAAYLIFRYQKRRMNEKEFD
ncbi:MAG: hypothetical protein KJO49_08660 [Bacteroidia bacterium]|nr:hypothetical protein [Bacteroidia bacterium]MBT8270178.1 hypothetical protein [Bacteroidia bacterium]NNK69793.1 hypothetical protein [Flavobacteriaceae bacterium]